MTQYLVYDVFTDQAFGGNPLAVIPDARTLPDDALQRIAREFNFSETTFVYAPADPAHTARVRIFTPTSELPFAGHPTIGTAIALSDQGATSPMVFELGVGPIACTVSDKGASFTTRAPLRYAGRPTVQEVAACLGLAPEQIATEAHDPVQASVGLHFAFVHLVDMAALENIQTDVAAFRLCQAKYPTGLDFGVAAYVRDGARIDMRVFAPLDNVPEDPATGSASAALAAHLSTLDGAAVDLTISQGVKMGRPSRIHAKTDVADGKVTAVTISGQAVRVMEGRLTLP